MTIRGEFAVGAMSAVMDDVYTSCPVAAASSKDVESVASAWRSWERGQLAIVAPRPSSALMDAVEMLAIERVKIDAYKTEIREQDRKLRGGA